MGFSKQLVNRFRAIDGIETILTLLQTHELIDLNCKQFTITPIAQGAINLNYKVQNKQHCMLLKKFSQNNVLPINRSQVFELQEQLAILKLAPRPMFLSVDELFYCEEWVRFQPICNDKVIASLAEALCNVHNSYISAPIVDLGKHWLLYWQTIKMPTAKLTRQFQQKCQQWQEYMSENKDHFVLCHNDLHLSHVCTLSGPLLDWEYAGLGCRYFDIVSCSIINQFNEAQKTELCNKYAELANVPVREVIDNTNKVTQMVMYTYNLWNYSLGLSDSL